MSWIVIALVPPALFAVSNYIDKYLLSTYFKFQGNGALVIFSSLVGIVALPFILIFDRTALAVAPFAAFLMAANGMLYIIGLLPYFSALREDDASVVAPLFQLIPVFGYVLGYLLLDETLRPLQVGAGLIVLLGAFGLSLDLEAARFTVKWRILGLMALASFLAALNGVAFKLLAIDDGSYWVTSFWGYVGLIALAVMYLLLAPRSRREFASVFRKNSGGALALNTANELVNVAGMFILNYALLLAPVALVFLANAAQPLFVLAYGIILTLLVPRLVNERIGRRLLVQKVVSIGVLVIGAFLMDAAS